MLWKDVMMHFDWWFSPNRTTKTARAMNEANTGRFHLQTQKSELHYLLTKKLLWSSLHFSIYLTKLALLNQLPKAINAWIIYTLCQTRVFESSNEHCKMLFTLSSLNSVRISGLNSVCYPHVSVKWTPLEVNPVPIMIMMKKVLMTSRVQVSKLERLS